MYEATTTVAPVRESDGAITTMWLVRSHDVEVLKNLDGPSTAQIVRQVAS